MSLIKLSNSSIPITRFPPLKSITLEEGHNLLMLETTVSTTVLSMFRVNRCPFPYNSFKKRELPMHLSLPFTITQTRSAKTSASSIEWVVKIMDRLVFNFSIKAHTCCLTLGSSPVVGSSRRMILGLPIAAMARLSLLFIPPLNPPTLLWTSRVNPTSYNNSEIADSTFSLGMPLREAKRCKCW